MRRIDEHMRFRKESNIFNSVSEQTSKMKKRMKRGERKE
jgi:hypothetical protein